MYLPYVCACMNNHMSVYPQADQETSCTASKQSFLVYMGLRFIKLLKLYNYFQGDKQAPTQAPTAESGALLKAVMLLGPSMPRERNSSA